jgi:acyl-CoA thioesterase FadM
VRHTVDYEILSHDTGHNGEVHPSAVFRYFQETADHQMRTEGPTYRELYEQGLAFVLSRMHVRLHATLRSYDKVTVQTWAYDPPRGVSYERYYQMYRGEELVAEAGSVWALLNVSSGELCRVGTLPLHYGSDEPLAISTRFRLPSAEFTVVDAHTVRYSDVDVNNHMNNTRYPDMLRDCIPHIDGLRITGIQIHYVSEALLGDTLTVSRAEAEENGHPVFWFQTEKQGGECNVRARIDTELL